MQEEEVIYINVSGVKIAKIFLEWSGQNVKIKYSESTQQEAHLKTVSN